MGDAAAAGSAKGLLTARELTVQRRDGALVLDYVNLTVAPGEIYCLLGSAGAGKTALLHVFLGFVPLTGGHAMVSDVDPARNPIEARRHITYVSRGAALYGSLTARQNVEFFVQVDGRRGRLARNDYYNAMRRVGIPERALERPARTLGAGVPLRLWLAIGLLKNTPILLIDEPTAGLDPHLSTDLQDAMVEFRKRNKALLIATSDVLLAGRTADRIGIMKEGRKSIELTQAELVGRPLYDLYLQYMGHPLPRQAAATDTTPAQPAQERLHRPC